VNFIFHSVAIICIYGVYVNPDSNQMITIGILDSFPKLW